MACARLHGLPLCIVIALYGLKSTFLPHLGRATKVAATRAPSLPSQTESWPRQPVKPCEDWNLSQGSLLTQTALAPNTGTWYNIAMRIIALKTLRTFWERHPAVRQPLQAWYYDVKRAIWTAAPDIKDFYRNASFLSNHRGGFNIKENQLSAAARVSPKC